MLLKTEQKPAACRWGQSVGHLLTINYIFLICLIFRLCTGERCIDIDGTIWSDKSDCSFAGSIRDAKFTVGQVYSINWRFVWYDNNITWFIILVTTLHVRDGARWSTVFIFGTCEWNNQGNKNYIIGCWPIT